MNYIKDNYYIMQLSIKEFQKHYLSLTNLLFAFDQVKALVSESNSDNIKIKLNNSWIEISI